MAYGKLTFTLFQASGMYIIKVFFVEIISLSRYIQFFLNILKSQLIFFPTGIHNSYQIQPQAAPFQFMEQIIVIPKPYFVWGI